jgi:hypothetical protein
MDIERRLTDLEDRMQAAEDARYHRFVASSRKRRRQVNPNWLIEQLKEIRSIVARLAGELTAAPARAPGEPSRIIRLSENQSAGDFFMHFDLAGGGRVHIPPDQVMRLWNEEQARNYIAYAIRQNRGLAEGKEGSVKEENR